VSPFGKLICETADFDDGGFDSRLIYRLLPLEAMWFQCMDRMSRLPRAKPAKQTQAAK
jgi:hypothetical protein